MTLTNDVGLTVYECNKFTMLWVAEGQQIHGEMSIDEKTFV